MEARDLNIEVVVLAGRSSGDQAVAMLADTGQGNAAAELWRGSQSGRHVLVFPPPACGHLPRDRRWSAAPESPLGEGDRIEFLGDITPEIVGDPSDWVEVARIRLELKKVALLDLRSDTPH